MNSLPTLIPTSRTCIEGASFSNSQCRLCFLRRQRKPVSLSIGIGCRLSSSIFDARSSLEQPEVVEETFMEWDSRNPAISSMYRCPKIPRPNQIVLEAQAKVCTGPEQTRPLTEEQAVKVLDTILKSASTKCSRAHHEKPGSSFKPHHPGHSEKVKCELICGTSSLR